MADGFSPRTSPTLSVAVVPDVGEIEAACVRLRIVVRIRSMARKSDRRRSEHSLSATEASRSFSEVLDRVEAGSRFLIRRRGRAVCLMAPPTVSSRRVSECLALLRGRTPVLLDERFSKDLSDILAGESVDERPSWDS
jgi:antitoxin (DNA-binding transcriptional repressor) of toxin-antitoxin stability system